MVLSHPFHSSPVAHPSNASERRSWLAEALPFLTSLALHALVLLVGLLTVKAIAVAHRDPMKVQSFFPVTTVLDNGELPSIDASGAPNLPMIPDQAPDRGALSKPFIAGQPSPKSSVGSSADETPMVFGPGASVGRPGGAGAGPGDGGASEFIGPRQVGGGGNGTFSRTGARRVVFLCDATGSMLVKMPQLKDELAKAIQRFKQSQMFDVIFFQDQKVVSFSPALVMANPQNKRRADAWLESMTAFGTTEPVRALESALKLNPQLIYFLTDAADFPDPQAVVQTIDRLNRDRAIKINTILFVEDQTERARNQDSEVLMKRIARENGGTFRWVRLDQLSN